MGRGNASCNARVGRRQPANVLGSNRGSVFVGLPAEVGLWACWRLGEGSMEGEGGSVGEGWGLVQAEGCKWGWGFGVWSGGQVSSTKEPLPQNRSKTPVFFQFFSSPFLSFLFEFFFFEFFLTIDLFFEFF